MSFVMTCWRRLSSIVALIFSCFWVHPMHHDANFDDVVRSLSDEPDDASLPEDVVEDVSAAVCDSMPSTAVVVRDSMPSTAVVVSDSGESHGQDDTDDFPSRLPTRGWVVERAKKREHVIMRAWLVATGLWESTGNFRRDLRTAPVVLQKVYRLSCATTLFPVSIRKAMRQVRRSLAYACIHRGWDRNGACQLWDIARSTLRDGYLAAQERRPNAMLVFSTCPVVPPRVVRCLYPKLRRLRVSERLSFEKCNLDVELAESFIHDPLELPVAAIGHVFDDGKLFCCRICFLFCFFPAIFILFFMFFIF